MISMSPSQKLGRERLTRVRRRAAWSIHEFRNAADRRPAGTPMATEKTRARLTRASVVGIRQTSSSDTRVLL